MNMKKSKVAASQKPKAARKRGRRRWRALQVYVPDGPYERLGPGCIRKLPIRYD